jgi:hypothetical protein
MMRLAAQQQPSYTAYAVTKRGDGQDDWWTPIGAAFEHKDGQGFNIVLQTIPLDGKIVLRPPKEERKSDDAERQRQTVRDANDRRRESRRDR